MARKQIIFSEQQIHEPPYFLITISLMNLNPINKLLRHRPQFLLPLVLGFLQRLQRLFDAAVFLSSDFSFRHLLHVNPWRSFGRPQ